MSKKSNTKEFIEKAIKIHGDKYDYSLVEYKNCITKVIIICKIHGEFLLSPDSHFKKKRICHLCKLDNININIEKKEEFILNANTKHNYKYDYNLVEYKNCDTKVIIICKIHGEFEQTPYNHLNYNNCCNKCPIKNINSYDKKDYKTDFINKAIIIHNDKYDYSKVKYLNMNMNVIIICKIHGEFEQTPRNHLRRLNCCKYCIPIKNINKIQLTTEEFIKKAIEIHGKKYDYNLVEYKNCDTKVIIICKIHCDFEQTPYQHLRTYGCKICSNMQGKLKQTYTTNNFIEQANKIHNYKYNYSKVNYINSKSKIIIICNLHGEFEQAAGSHLKSNIGCKKCGKCYKWTTTEYIEKVNKIHNFEYDYSKTIYIKQSEKITIICKLHGEFIMTAGGHLTSKSKCPKCMKNFRYSTIEFIKKANIIHNNKYDYYKFNYMNAITKTIIICNKHGEFKQTPTQHIQGSGCPNCVNKTEGKLLNILQDNYYYSDIITQFKVDWCKNKTFLPFDFLIEEHKIIIELDGRQHFKQISNWKSSKETQKRDKYKMKCANDNGYSVIRIFQEDVWDDKFNWFEILEDSIEYIVHNKLVLNVFISKDENLYNNYL